MAGFCDEIKVVLHSDNSVSIFDNGRGIPVDIHEKTKIPAVQLVMTSLHAGGKFDSSSYKISGGLNGVGASVVNALSEKLHVEIHRDGYLVREGVCLQAMSFRNLLNTNGHLGLPNATQVKDLYSFLSQTRFLKT